MTWIIKAAENRDPQCRFLMGNMVHLHRGGMRGSPALRATQTNSLNAVCPPQRQALGSMLSAARDEPVMCTNYPATCDRDQKDQDPRLDAALMHQCHLDRTPGSPGRTPVESVKSRLSGKLFEPRDLPLGAQGEDPLYD
jgi:hypothetical protein